MDYSSTAVPFPGFCGSCLNEGLTDTWVPRSRMVSSCCTSDLQRSQRLRVDSPNPVTAASARLLSFLCGRTSSVRRLILYFWDGFVYSIVYNRLPGCLPYGRRRLCRSRRRARAFILLAAYIFLLGEVGHASLVPLCISACTRSAVTAVLTELTRGNFCVFLRNFYFSCDAHDPIPLLLFSQTCSGPAHQIPSCIFLVSHPPPFQPPPQTFPFA